MFFKKKTEPPKPTAAPPQTPPTEPAPVEAGSSPPVTPSTVSALEPAPPIPEPATPAAPHDEQQQPTNETALSPEDLRKHALIAKQRSAIFGEIVSVFMHTSEFKGLTLGQVEHLIVPAVVTGQFSVANAQSKANGMSSPVAVVLWAKVSSEVEQHLANELDKPIKLEPKDWNSGDNHWIIAVAGDRRIIDGMITKMKSEIFKDRAVKMRARDKQGSPIVVTLSTATAAA